MYEAVFSKSASGSEGVTLSKKSVCQILVIIRICRSITKTQARIVAVVSEFGVTLGISNAHCTTDQTYFQLVDI